jgi:hypothetical protein
LPEFHIDDTFEMRTSDSKLGKRANYQREREREDESARVAERRSERHLEIPELGGKHVFTKRGRMPLGTD